MATNPIGETRLIRFVPAVALAALLSACAAAGPPPGAALPERIVLFYDFAGNWAPTAGDTCEARLGLSDVALLSVVRASEDTPRRLHVDDFFLLEPGRKAQALVGEIADDGSLTLEIESEGEVDGREAAIVWRLRLEPHDTGHVRMTGLTMTARAGGEAATRDLLAADAAPNFPELAIAGPGGLCLRRM